MNHRMDLTSQFLLLQINDALFPIGGYSHSYGLETYIQKGLVHDSQTAEEYMRKRLRWGVLYSDLLPVRLAWEAASAEDLKALDALEEETDASRIPMEIREASRKLGKRFAKTVLAMGLPQTEGLFADYINRRKGNALSHPCAYGVFCQRAGIDKEQAMAHYLYAQASAGVTNCVKTVPLSQTEGQRILAALGPLFEEILAEAMEAGEELLGISAPGFDLRSIQHESLYSRLYMS